AFLKTASSADAGRPRTPAAATAQPSPVAAPRINVRLDGIVASIVVRSSARGRTRGRGALEAKTDPLGFPSRRAVLESIAGLGLMLVLDCCLLVVVARRFRETITGARRVGVVEMAR